MGLPVTSARTSGYFDVEKCNNCLQKPETVQPLGVASQIPVFEGFVTIAVHPPSCALRFRQQPLAPECLNLPSDI